MSVEVLILVEGCSFSDLQRMNRGGYLGIEEEQPADVHLGSAKDWKTCIWEVDPPVIEKRGFDVQAEC